VRSLYFGSSLSKTGTTQKNLLTDTLEPTNEWYAIAKITGESLSGPKTTMARLRKLDADNLYGTHDNFDLTSSHVLPAMMRKFRGKGKMAMPGNLGKHQ
jgi:nucleoside-diphosphate-sugar epimerase